MRTQLALGANAGSSATPQPSTTSSSIFVVDVEVVVIHGRQRLIAHIRTTVIRLRDRLPFKAMCDAPLWRKLKKSAFFPANS
jgi:hypothetical protein